MIGCHKLAEGRNAKCNMPRYDKWKHQTGLNFRVEAMLKWYLFALPVRSEPPPPPPPPPTPHCKMEFIPAKTWWIKIAAEAGAGAGAGAAATGGGRQKWWWKIASEGLRDARHKVLGRPAELPSQNPRRWMWFFPVSQIKKPRRESVWDMPKVTWFPSVRSKAPS